MKAELARFLARWPQPRLPGFIDLGFVSPHRSGSAVPAARTCITKVARFPSPGLRSPDHMCVPTAQGWMLGAGVVVFLCFSLMT